MPTRLPSLRRPWWCLAVALCLVVGSTPAGAKPPDLPQPTEYDFAPGNGKAKAPDVSTGTGVQIRSTQMLVPADLFEEEEPAPRGMSPADRCAALRAAGRCVLFGLNPLTPFLRADRCLEYDDTPSAPILHVGDCEVAVGGLLRDAAVTLCTGPFSPIYQQLRTIKAPAPPVPADEEDEDETIEFVPLHGGAIIEGALPKPGQEESSEPPPASSMGPCGSSHDKDFCPQTHERPAEMGSAEQERARLADQYMMLAQFFGSAGHLGEACECYERVCALCPDTCLAREAMDRMQALCSSMYHGAANPAVSEEQETPSVCPSVERGANARKQVESPSASEVLGALGNLVSGCVDAFLGCSSEPGEPLPITSEDLRQIEAEWQRFWFADQPSHVAYDRIHGGIIEAGVTGNKKMSLEDRLGLPVSLNCKDASVARLLDDLRNWQGINIVLDKKALEEDGISPDAKVTIRVENVSLKSALNLTLRQVGLTWKIQDEVVLVTTPRVGRGALIRKTYDIADLVADQPSRKCKTAAQREEEADDADELIDLIEQTIAPETWASAGGNGAIEYFSRGRALVVNQTTDTHEQIADLLAALRKLVKPEQSGDNEEAGSITPEGRQGVRRSLVGGGYDVSDFLTVPDVDWNRKADRLRIMPTAVPVGELIALIRDGIAPESWDVRGGAGKIHYNSDLQTLFIEQTPEVHEAIQELLDARRHEIERHKKECERQVEKSGQREEPKSGKCPSPTGSSCCPAVPDEFEELIEGIRCPDRSQDCGAGWDEPPPDRSLLYGVGFGSDAGATANSGDLPRLIERCHEALKAGRLDEAETLAVRALLRDPFCGFTAPVIAVLQFLNEEWIPPHPPIPLPNGGCVQFSVPVSPKDDSVYQLLEQCRHAVKSRRFAEAEMFAAQALALDPFRVAADPLINKMHLLAQRKARPVRLQPALPGSESSIVRAYNEILDTAPPKLFIEVHETGGDEVQQPPSSRQPAGAEKPMPRLWIDDSPSELRIDPGEEEPEAGLNILKPNVCLDVDQHKEGAVRVRCQLGRFCLRLDCDQQGHGSLVIGLGADTPDPVSQLLGTAFEGALKILDAALNPQKKAQSSDND